MIQSRIIANVKLKIPYILPISKKSLTLASMITPSEVSIVVAVEDVDEVCCGLPLLDIPSLAIKKISILNHNKYGILLT